MDETLGECQSTILATNLNSMGAEGYNGSDCTNTKRTCQATTNKYACRNSEDYCVDTINYSKCNNGYEPVPNTCVDPNPPTPVQPDC